MAISRGDPEKRGLGLECIRRDPTGDASLMKQWYGEGVYRKLEGLGWALGV